MNLSIQKRGEGLTMGEVSDGYRLELEHDRIQRMRMEKEEETKKEWIVRSRVKEWEGEIRSTIQNEIRKEMGKELDRLRKEREEGSRELKIYLEEMKEIKEILKEEMESMRKLRKEKEQAESQMEQLKEILNTVMESQKEERKKIRI